MSRKVKGEILLKDIEYLTKKRGADCVDGILSRIGFRKEEITTEKWYPLDWHVKFLRVVEAEMGTGDNARCEEVGRYASSHIGGMLKFVVRFASMERLIKSLPKSYNFMYEGGRLEMVSFDAVSKKVVYRHHGISDDPCYCRGWLGAYRGFFDLHRKKCRIEEVLCSTRGDAYCEYVLNWD